MKALFGRRSLLAGGISALCLMSTPVFAQDPLKIAVSLPSLSFPFFVHMQKAFEAEAATIDGLEITVLDGGNSAPKQTGDVEAAVVQKVDAIVIAPLDVNALAPALEAAIAAGIPVVTVDRNAADVDGIILHVGADNAKGGEVQANQVMADFPDGAKIFHLQGQPGAGPAIERNKGVHAVLDGVKDKYPIVFEQTANFARAEGLSVTETALAANGKPDAIIAANDDMALGAYEALDAAGITGVHIYGFDALPETLALIRDGKLRATIEQTPGEQSRTALRAAVDFVRDKKSPEAPLKLLEPFALLQDNVTEAERISEVK